MVVFMVSGDDVRHHHSSSSAGDEEAGVAPDVSAPTPTRGDTRN
jgi:hypothetical protein